MKVASVPSKITEVPQSIRIVECGHHVLRVQSAIGLSLTDALIQFPCLLCHGFEVVGLLRNLHVVRYVSVLY
jgi:hypothetical protein